MHILSLVLITLVSCILAHANAFAQVSDQDPPTAVIVSENFSPMRHTWAPVNGSWAVSSSAYGSNAAGENDLAIILQYRGVEPSEPVLGEIVHADFYWRARVRNQGTNDTHHVGIVYGYQDSQNYHELLLSAVGHLRVRTVQNGITTDDQPSFGATNCTSNVWCDIEVRRTGTVTQVKVNGQRFFQNVIQRAFIRGLVGLVTHGAVGRFDKVFLGVPYGDQPFLQTFPDPSRVNFPGRAGIWAVVDGTYRSNVVQTALATAPIFSGNGNPTSTQTRQYTFRVRMLNPFGGAGNLMGVMFNYDVVTGDYVEAVFSPTGVAHLRRFQNGVMSTIATDSYNGARNVPFEVQLENGPNHAAFLVDGKRLFPSVVPSDVNPEHFPTGFIGLVTHWTPGRFDNARFDHGFFEQPCSFSFNNPPPSHWIVSGTWNNTGGTLNNTSTGSSDIVDFKCLGNLSGEDAGTNAVYSARLMNTFGASGNLVGMVYNYHGTNSFYAGDYFEVVFSSTGIVQLNKFIQGVRYPVRTLSHNIPRNTFFDVQVFRNGIFTTIKLNGATIVENEPQGELSGGSIGVITHFSRGRFDNVTLREHVVHPPSEL